MTHNEDGRFATRFLIASQTPGSTIAGDYTAIRYLALLPDDAKIECYNVDARDLLICWHTPGKAIAGAATFAQTSPELRLALQAFASQNQATKPPDDNL